MSEYQVSGNLTEYKRQWDALRERAERAEFENTKLRVLLAASGADCAYCGLPAAEMAKCASGFPGPAPHERLVAGIAASERPGRCS